jgi:hypothetical protein
VKWKYWIIEDAKTGEPIGSRGSLGVGPTNRLSEAYLFTSREGAEDTATRLGGQVRELNAETT